MWAGGLAQPEVGPCGSSARCMSTLKPVPLKCPAAASAISLMAWLAASTQLPAALSKALVLDASTGGGAGGSVGSGVGVELTSVALGMTELSEQPLSSSASARSIGRRRTTRFMDVMVPRPAASRPAAVPHGRVSPHRVKPSPDLVWHPNCLLRSAFSPTAYRPLFRG